MTGCELTLNTPTTRHQRYPALALALSALLGCGASVVENQRVTYIDLPGDLRGYARDARATLPDLDDRRRVLLEPALDHLDAAIAAFDDLSSQGGTRERLRTPVIGVAVGLTADDLTGYGLANDVVLPFLAVGVLAITLSTDAPASENTLHIAREQVLTAARRVKEAMESTRTTGVGTSVGLQSAATAAPGTRQGCIDLYVDCQQNAPWPFDLRKCQPCMDKCLANGYRWPTDPGCHYRKERR